MLSYGCWPSKKKWKKVHQKSPDIENSPPSANSLEPKAVKPFLIMQAKKQLVANKNVNFKCNEPCPLKENTKIGHFTIIYKFFFEQKPL
jgi:hypothetical protein